MEYIPRKKMLTEKYSQKTLFTEELNEIFEQCYLLTIPPSFTNMNITLVYFMFQKQDEPFVLVKIDNIMNITEINVNFIWVNYFCADLKFDIELIGYTFLNYFKRKTNHILHIYNINRINMYLDILKEYKEYLEQKR